MPRLPAKLRTALAPLPLGLREGGRAWSRTEICPSPVRQAEVRHHCRCSSLCTGRDWFDDDDDDTG